MTAGNAARAGSASAGEALAMLHAALDYLAGTDWRVLSSQDQAGGLRSAGSAMARLAAVHAAALRAFDQAGGSAADGQASARSWLVHQARVTRPAARDLDRAASRLAAHPALGQAQAAGEVSESWARQFAAWNDRLPADEADHADAILLDAARAGLDLYPDIARLAQAIYEAVKGRQPDPDDPGDGFADRGVRLSTTIGGAGRLHGDLSASCAALLDQVFAALGKSAGSDDLRGPGQRNHDALEAALGLALAAPGIPGTSGMKTRATALMSLRDLLQIGGADDLCEAWLSARAGEPGWLFGPAARAAACAGQVTPVITGTPDWDVLGGMADLFLDAHGLSRREPSSGDGSSSDDGSSSSSSDAASQPAGSPLTGHSPAGPLSGAARLALERTLLRMAIRAVAGPGGLAGFLRSSLLGRPFSGASLILDAGATDDIPDHIRRAVMLRDRHCQWPGGCDRPASQCEPHHRQPRADGGDTSAENLDLYCRVHHHHYIHRAGWTIVKHPDGSRQATSPTGRTLTSHAPARPG